MNLQKKKKSSPQISHSNPWDYEYDITLVINVTLHGKGFLKI